MRPLFPPTEAFEALERVATANQMLAAQLEAEIAGRPYRIREERRPELLERWRTSGKAYAELADALRESPKYPDILWISSEHFRKGHDFEHALAQMTRFINTQPRQACLWRTCVAARSSWTSADSTRRWTISSAS